MNVTNENTLILNAESQEQLTKSRNAELGKVLKLRFVLAELLRTRVNEIDLPEKEQVEWALKILSIRSYLRLNEDSKDYLLNLELCRQVAISYTERKAVRQYLINRLRVVCKPIVEFGQRMRAELPEVFSTVSLDTDAASSTVAAGGEQMPASSYAIQLRDLELQRRENLLKLVELRNRKCAYMKAAAELKMGPYQKNELEILYAQSRMNQVKAMLMRSFMLSELVGRSNYTLRAIKAVEHFIDEALEQSEK